MRSNDKRNSNHSSGHPPSPPPAPLHSEFLSENLLISPPRSLFAMFLKNLCRWILMRPSLYILELFEETVWAVKTCALLLYFQTRKNLIPALLSLLRLMARWGVLLLRTFARMGRMIYLRTRRSFSSLKRTYGPVLKAKKAQALAIAAAKATNGAERSMHGAGRFAHAVFTGFASLFLLLLHIIHGRISRTIAFGALAVIIATGLWIPSLTTLKSLGTDGSAFSRLDRQIKEINRIHSDFARGHETSAARSDSDALAHLAIGTKIQISNLQNFPRRLIRNETGEWIVFYFQSGGATDANSLKANRPFCRLALRSKTTLAEPGRFELLIAARSRTESDRVYGLDQTSLRDHESASLTCWDYAGAISIGAMLETLGPNHSRVEMLFAQPVAGL